MNELRTFTVSNSGDMTHSQMHDKFTQSMNNLEGCEKEFKRELQAMKSSESHLREYLENSIKESLHCKEAVNNLLNFANQVALYKKKYCINALITDVTVSLYRMFNESKIDIVFNLSDNLPNVLIDICKMELVFANIFYNAIYAIKALTEEPVHISNHVKGTITIETRMSTNKDEIEISISDTGVYIHKNNLKKIFTPFFTQKAETERPIIGLGIAGKIIRMHNGVIAAESEQETGTTFKIFLPLKEKISKQYI
jgi:signal transduction histidine kinase